MCCGHDTSPVEITSSTSSFSTVTFLPTVLNALSVLHAEDAHTLPMHSASLDLPIDAGPPRFLSLQRILI